MSDTSHPPSIQSLDAVVLIAKDFERQCEFYGNTLGLVAKASYRDAAFFGAGNQAVAIFAKSHHPEGKNLCKVPRMGCPTSNSGYAAATSRRCSNI